MIRNSITYRRIWYLKRRNSKRLYIWFRLLSIVIILAAMVFYAENYSFTYIKNIVCTRVVDMIRDEAKSVIRDTAVSERGQGQLKYIMKMENGEIISGDNHSESIIRIPDEVSGRLRKSLNTLSKEGFKIPVGAFIGNTVFSRIGPKIYLKLRWHGDIVSFIKSEAVDSCNNQGKNKVYVSIKTKVGMIFLLKERLLEIDTDIEIGENGVFISDAG
ncbi:MAG: hypothetical protein N3I35_18320 [Clostridia bacterium]|nr:hypothetical protein [Clostridia bacterium]